MEMPDFTFKISAIVLIQYFINVVSVSMSGMTVVKFEILS